MSTTTPPALAFADFELTPDNLILRHMPSGKYWQLRPKEFRLILFLYNNRQKIVSKSDLMELIWNYDLCNQSKTVETHIYNLRKILKTDSPSIIQTVHGTGYRLMA